ncbi:hypothetical protein SAMN05444373_103722 [Thermoclostridium caenicola]|uniref:Uncharacterized protein n=1 Tax=Thermoclostridium caenicola TaxID=659425 RepID=A0A1M6I070_9FIRM|nr:hypothetical protein SAMN05444373_103722 [Thermoclostridium caenicola]
MSIQTSLEHVEQKKEKGFIRNLLNRMDINAVCRW